MLANPNPLNNGYKSTSHGRRRSWYSTQSGNCSLMVKVSQKNRQRFLYSHHLESSDRVTEFTRKFPLSLNLRKKFSALEGSGYTSTSSTSIFSPSYCGRYLTARLYRIMSKESHSAKLEPGVPKKEAKSLEEHKDTSESWALVMVERHFSTNLQGRFA